jgi:hypothetical protein
MREPPDMAKGCVLRFDTGYFSYVLSDRIQNKPINLRLCGKPPYRLAEGGADRLGSRGRESCRVNVRRS